jgi:hypothetical protein
MIVFSFFLLHWRSIPTSERIVQDLRQPNRRTPMNVLTAKTYKFVDEICAKSR